MKICGDCGREWPLDRYNLDGPAPWACFACRAGSFRGATFSGGREFFHNKLVAQEQKRTIREAKAQGHDPVPKWTTQYAGASTASQTERLKKHYESRAAAATGG